MNYSFLHYFITRNVFEIVHGCTALNRKRESVVRTTNAIYGCEELVDAASIYDDIDENHCHDLNQQNVYLDVLGDETERCDPPELPSLRPEKDSEGLKERNPESVYLHVLHDETEGNDENTKAEDQIQNQGTEQQEKA